MRAIPDWKKSFAGSKLQELLTTPQTSTELMELVTKANEESLHWDDFRFKPMPRGISKDVGWAFLKLMRLGNAEKLRILDASGTPFSYRLTKSCLRDLSYIDSYTSGTITTSDGLPDIGAKRELVINGLIEEAISSSQIEGANTTRKVAKSMLELNRPAKNRDEQMILNNYRAMTHLEDWKTRPLDDEFLLELHQLLTVNTLENKADEGRFRTDADEIIVQDKATGETVFTPPKWEIARKELDQLYEFANNSIKNEGYIHPFIKASVLHFCLAYIHPFVDGNGRSARAVFYWYLLKENYWVFQYLPISLQIKKRRPAYDKAFQHVETDDSDLTYFLYYKLHVARSAITDFQSYLRKQQQKANELKKHLVSQSEINERQLALIKFFQKNPTVQIDLQFYRNRQQVVYETARSDLAELVDRKILRKAKYKKKYIYTRGERFPSQ